MSLLEREAEPETTDGLKRTSSHRSLAASEVDTVRSQRSASAAAGYRHKILATCEIHLHVEPPNHIRDAIDDIVNADIARERRTEIRSIYQQFSDSCLDNVRAQSGEDDFLDPLHTALKAFHLQHLCLHEKADWKHELKPVLPRDLYFSSSFMVAAEPIEEI